MPRVDLTKDALQACDVAVIVTDHTAFDYEAVAQHAPAIVDTRNALATHLGPAAAHQDHVTLLGGGDGPQAPHRTR